MPLSKGRRCYTCRHAKGKFAIVGVSADTYALTVRKDAVVKMNESDIGVSNDQITDLGTISLP